MTRTNVLVRGLREQIADSLRADIISGHLAEGEQINENKMVDRFAVSRTPIRGALLQLTQEGLLEAKPNCSVRVAPRITDEIQELIVPIRRTIETFALRMFYDEINEADYQEWEEILERLKVACEKSDYTAIAKEDIIFHRSIIRRAGLRDLEVIWQIIAARVHMNFQLEQEKNPEPMEIYAEHVSIVEAIRSGDRDKAIEVLGANIV